MLCRVVSFSRFGGTRYGTRDVATMRQNLGKMWVTTEVDVLRVVDQLADFAPVGLRDKVAKRGSGLGCRTEGDSWSRMWEGDGPIAAEFGGLSRRRLGGGR